MSQKSVHQTTDSTTNTSRVKRKRHPRPAASQYTANVSNESASFVADYSMSDGFGEPLKWNMLGSVVHQHSTPAEISHPQTFCEPPVTDHLICAVCGDHALGYNFDCISCESCKTFFRRNAFRELRCASGGHCITTLATRRRCSACRFQKCLAVGMKRHYIYKVNVDEQGKYMGKSGVLKANNPTLYVNDAHQPREDTDDIRHDLDSRSETCGDGSFSREVSSLSMQPNPSSTSSMASLDAELNSPNSISRSSEDQHWDRIFKPRVALERSRRSRNASSATFPLSPESSSSSPAKQPASSIISSPPSLLPVSEMDWRAEEPPNKLQRPSDPRAMQEMNRSLVSHMFVVEPSIDLEYALNVTSITKCGAINHQVSASTSYLSDEEFSAILKSMQRAISVLKRPISFTESQIIPQIPRNLNEGLAYANFAVKRIIQCLQVIPEFAALKMEDRLKLLKSMASMFVRMNIYVWFEPSLQSMTFPLENPEPDPFNPNLHWFERRLSVLSILERNLREGVIEASALVINLFNYTIEVLSSVGDDPIIRSLIAFINIFSSHRFAACPHLLATLTPINAVLFQFLRQYIDRFDVSSSSSPFSAKEFTPIHVSSDFSQLLAFGQSVPSFERLAVEKRRLVASFIQYPPITSRLHTVPNGNRADWLFAFCIAALNDPRIDEVSQHDYHLRNAFSQKFTPLIMELLANNTL